MLVNPRLYREAMTVLSGDLFKYHIQSNLCWKFVDGYKMSVVNVELSKNTFSQLVCIFIFVPVCIILDRQG